MSPENKKLRAERLRARLNFVGWSQKEFALRLYHVRVVPPHVSSWTCGTRWPSSLIEKEMARVLGVTMGYFSPPFEPVDREPPSIYLVTEGLGNRTVPEPLLEWLRSKGGRLGLRKEPIFRTPVARGSGMTEDLAIVAERLRCRWGIGTEEPIADLALCLARRKILVWSVPEDVPMPRDTSAVSGRIDGFAFIATQPALKVGARDWRFAVAAELARVLFAGTKGEGTTNAKAKRFARAFLVPRVAIETNLLQFEAGRSKPEFLACAIDLLSYGWGLPWFETWARIQDVWRFRRAPLVDAKLLGPADDAGTPAKTGVELWASWYAAGAELSRLMSIDDAHEMRRRITDPRPPPWSVGLKEWPQS